jgi:signal transduction histidine kinase
VLSLKAENGELRGALVDDGVGFDDGNGSSTKGFGLDNMEERIRKVGGHFSINSIPGRGTRVSFTVPLSL